MIQAVALLSMFGVGITFSIIGALKLTLSERLGIDDGRIGVMISVFMITCAVAVIPVGSLIDNIGFKPVIVTGFMLGFVAVLVLVTSKRYRQALVACILLGAASICLNMSNILTPVVMFGGQNKTAAANFGNVFFGLGAFTTPLLIGMLLRRIGFIATGAILATVLLVPSVISLSTGFPVSTGEYSLPRAIELLTSPTILIAAAAMFCYIGLETSMGGWITTYANEHGFTQGGASLLLSLFWISITVIRLPATALITADIGAVVAAVLSMISVLTLIVMLHARTKLIAGVSIILTGLAFGPIFPTVLGVALEKTDASFYGSAFGIMYAIGLLGGSTIPAAVGIYARTAGIRQSMSIVVCFSIILTGITIMMIRM